MAMGAGESCFSRLDLHSFKRVAARWAEGQDDFFGDAGVDGDGFHGFAVVLAGGGGCHFQYTLTPLPQYRGDGPVAFGASIVLFFVFAWNNFNNCAFLSMT
jgi:hypothetical protein